MPTVAETLKQVTDALAKAGIDRPARDARILVAHAMDVPTDRLTLLLRDELEDEDQELLAKVLPRRLAREPLSHITGSRQFWKHDFAVTPDVLDPRPETELLVELALHQSFANVLDLGTGSGAILLSILMDRPGATGVGVDLSAPALEVAKTNAARFGVEDRVRLVQSDWFEKVQWRFDLIVSNPPYVTAAEMETLAPELAHEPRSALTDEGDGLAAYRQIACQARDFLAPGGRLIVEIGSTQAPEVSDLFVAGGLESVSVERDLDGRDRAVQGRKPLKGR